MGRTQCVLTVAAAALATPAGVAQAEDADQLAFSLDNPQDASIAEVLGGLGKDFLWATATAAYQVEGAWDEGGRQKSIWDVFSQAPGHTFQGETGNVADDFYHRYEEDIRVMKQHGFNAFRYSISWPRIFPRGPDGRRSANPAGVAFYKKLTRSLLHHGITPVVTLFHWDLPDDLDWLEPTVVDAFVEYADFVFQTFPEVSHWATFNEPWTFCKQGYELGTSAPGKTTEFGAYVCGHHVLQAHAKVAAQFRLKYHHPGSTLGMVINYDWTFPLNASSSLDLAAVQCSIDFQLGWFADPIYFGDYPPCMKEHLGENLPAFTPQEKALLSGSVTGPYLLNTYGGRYTTWDPSKLEGHRPSFTDINGELIGPQAASSWLHVVPTEIRAHLEYVAKRYKPQGIIVTENGCDVPHENELPLQDALEDGFRVNFYRAYLAEVAKAVKESGVPLLGYTAWSWMDNFEWADGYAKRFGLSYVNYTTQERYPKASAKWFRDMIAAGRLPPAAPTEDATIRLI